MSMAIKAHNLTVGYHGKTVLSGLDLDLPANQIICLLGANGSGKSTLLQCLAGLKQPEQGLIEIGGTPIQRLTGKQRARQVAFLAQHPQAPDELTVRELIMLGRYPYRRMFAPPSPADYKAVATALAQTEITAQADQALGQLSGGQRQRAWIAMILAQESDILLLDEPTSYLDIAHQYELLRLLQALNKQQGKSIIMVLHDLNQAIEVADQLVLLKSGKLIAQGNPAHILDEPLIREVFGLRCQLVQNPVKPCPLIVPV